MTSVTNQKSYCQVESRVVLIRMFKQYYATYPLSAAGVAISVALCKPLHEKTKALSTSGVTIKDFVTSPIGTKVPSS